MADEAIITPDTEVKDVAGTVEAELNKEVAPSEVKEPKTETVPLAVFLELKDELKTLKHEIKEAKGLEKSTIAVRGLNELSQKYPTVEPEFIQDILNSATSEATRKIEEKYSPIIEKQEIEKKQVALDKAFDNLFEQALSANPDLPQTIDKELVKELALTPKYRNVPVADIILKMYGTGLAGKSSSENEVRSGAEKVDGVVDFEKITDEQRKEVMADPKARTKYFDWLDTQTGR